MEGCMEGMRRDTAGPKMQPGRSVQHTTRHKSILAPGVPFRHGHFRGSLRAPHLKYDSTIQYNGKEGEGPVSKDLASTTKKKLAAVASKLQLLAAMWDSSGSVALRDVKSQDCWVMLLKARQAAQASDWGC